MRKPMNEKLDQLTAFLVLVLLFIAVCAVWWGIVGCAEIDKAQVAELVEANVGGLVGRVATVETRIGELNQQIGGVNDNVTTWLAVAGGPVCLAIYVIVWRPIRRAREAIRMNGMK